MSTGAGAAGGGEGRAEGVEAGLRGGAGRGVAVPGGNVVVVETEGVPGGYGLGEEPAPRLLTGAGGVGGAGGGEAKGGGVWAALGSAGVVLVKGDLRGVARARRLSRGTMRRAERGGRR